MDHSIGIECFRYWKREHFSAIEHLKTLLLEHHPNEEISVRKKIQIEFTFWFQHVKYSSQNSPSIRIRNIFNICDQSEQ